MNRWRRWAALAIVVAAIAGIIVVLQLTIAPKTGGSAPIATGTTAPEFTDIAEWLNSPPLTLASLRGKVVVVDFWDYSCINCIRTVPYLKQWNAKYASSGLVIVGVHSPEFEFEKATDNVRQAAAKAGMTWPLALDNDFATWRAYGNQYWPHKYLIDKDGRLRYDHIGEGGYAETEQRIRGLLGEAGHDLSAIAPGEPDAATSNARITREVYAGYERAIGGYLGNFQAAQRDQPADFTDPGTSQDGQFFLQGAWQINAENAQHARQTQNFEDYVTISYTAASVNAVLRSQGPALTVQVTLDGKPVPIADRGVDILMDPAGQTYLMVDAPRLYYVLSSKTVGVHKLKLAVSSSDFLFYTFTFGS